MKSTTIRVGSQAWFDYWASWYYARALRRAARGFKYPGDDVACWEALLEWQYWTQDIHPTPTNPKQ